jgi:hypothetical protein
MRARRPATLVLVYPPPVDVPAGRIHQDTRPGFRSTKGDPARQRAGFLVPAENTPRWCAATLSRLEWMSYASKRIDQLRVTRRGALDRYSAADRPPSLPAGSGSPTSSAPWRSTSLAIFNRLCRLRRGASKSRHGTSAGDLSQATAPLLLVVSRTGQAERGAARANASFDQPARPLGARTRGQVRARALVRGAASRRLPSL